MCLHSTIRENKKWLPNKKNGGNAPIMKDARTKYVATPCGKCMECRKQKARGWSIRLQEEIRTDKTGQFVTLTFSNEAIYEIINGNKYHKGIEGLTGYDLDNEIATKATRYFLERWRKKYKKSVKHWLITELGQPNAKHQGTENVHIHGFIFTDKPDEIKEIWQYGYVYIGEYVNEKTINYCVKYATKIDEAHPNYQAKILTSAGIGAGYLERADALDNKFKNNGTTRETYTTRSGHKVALPTYLRNKIYTEEEREELWIQKLDKNERWVDGVKARTDKEYFDLLSVAQEKNKRMGYGSADTEWEKVKYENERRSANLDKRLKKVWKNKEVEECMLILYTLMHIQSDTYISKSKKSGSNSL